MFLDFFNFLRNFKTDFRFFRSNLNWRCWLLLRCLVTDLFLILCSDTKYLISQRFQPLGVNTFLLLFNCLLWPFKLLLNPLDPLLDLAFLLANIINGRFLNSSQVFLSVIETFNLWFCAQKVFFLWSFLVLEFRGVCQVFRQRLLSAECEQVFLVET